MRSPLKLIAIVLATSIVLSGAVVGTTKLATRSDNTYDVSSTVVQNANADWKNHTEVVDFAVEPGCTTPGMTEGVHCSDCGEILIAQEEVPAKGHDIIMEQLVYETEEGNEEIVVRATFLCGHAEVTVLYWEADDGETIEMLPVSADPASDRSTAVFVPKKTGVVTVKANTADGFTPEQSATIVVHSKDRMLLPEGVTVITAGMFDGSDAEEIVIPEGVTHIEANAFVNCPKLKIVVLPDSLRDISPNAFEKTESITIICSANSVGAQFAGSNGVACLPFETEVRTEYAEPTDAPAERKKADDQDRNKVTARPETEKPTNTPVVTDAPVPTSTVTDTATSEPTAAPTVHWTNPPKDGGENSTPEDNGQEPTNPTQAPAPATNPPAQQEEPESSGGGSQSESGGGEPAQTTSEVIETAAEVEGSS